MLSGRMNQQEASHIASRSGTAGDTVWRSRTLTAVHLVPAGGVRAIEPMLFDAAAKGMFMCRHNVHPRQNHTKVIVPFCAYGNPSSMIVARVEYHINLVSRHGFVLPAGRAEFLPR